MLGAQCESQSPRLSRARWRWSAGQVCPLTCPPKVAGRQLSEFLVSSSRRRAERVPASLAGSVAGEAWGQSCRPATWPADNNHGAVVSCASPKVTSGLFPAFSDDLIGERSGQDVSSSIQATRHSTARGRYYHRARGVARHHGGASSDGSRMRWQMAEALHT